MTMCNLSNINAAIRGGLMEVIELRLTCVGAGPTLDFEDATAVRDHDREGAKAAAAMRG